MSEANDEGGSGRHARPQSLRFARGQLPRKRGSSYAKYFASTAS